MYIFNILSPAALDPLCQGNGARVMSAERAAQAANKSESAHVNKQRRRQVASTKRTASSGKPKQNITKISASYAKCHSKYNNSGITVNC